MGGLVAVLAAREDAPITARRMLAAAPHRGGHIEVVELGACVLGIQDHEPGADAGLAAGNGLAVAFTGAIDNLDALRPPQTGPDTLATPAEVLLAAARLHGDGLPARARGPFAAVVTDGRRVWCFRDHLGLKSLYYRRDDRGFFVASEAKQVVAGAGISSEPDLEVVHRIFFRDIRSLLPSALRGVDRVEQASIVESDGEQIRTVRYWHPESLLESARLRDDEIRDSFDALMRQASERSITGSDVVLLSGGIDSPAIAAYAAPPHRQLTGKRLTALSYVYPDSPSDERVYTEEVADYLGLDLHLAQPKANTLEDMAEWVRLADGPIPVTSMPQYAESYRLSRDLGATNVLSGELAEFLMAFRNYLIQHLIVRGRVGPLARELIARRRAGAELLDLARELVAPLVPARVSAARARADTGGIPPWIDPRAINDPIAASLGWIGRRWTQKQLASFSGTSASMAAEEICQQVCRVRARRPWADIDLWEFFLSLRAEDKQPHGLSKELVRRMLRGRVPDSILDRRDKTVFDESVRRGIDYPELTRLLSRREHRLPGVDYALLDQRLERRDFSAIEFVWAKDLASVHAFLSLW